MQHFKLYHQADELHVTSDRAIGEPIKITTARDRVYLQTATNELFIGTALDDTNIHLQCMRDDVTDVACSADALYVVDVNGRVQRTLLELANDEVSPSSNSSITWTDVLVIARQPTFQLTSQSKFNCDSRLWHGIGEAVPIAKLWANDDGVLLLATTGELYGMGQMPDVCMSDEPIVLPFFVDYDIVQVAMGKHFAVVLTRNKQLQRRAAGMDASQSDAISVSSAYSIGSTMASSVASSMVASEVPNRSDMQMLDAHTTSTAHDGSMQSHTPTPSNVSSSKSSQETLDRLETISSSDNTSLKTVENYADGECSSSDHDSLLMIDIEHGIAKLLSSGCHLIRTNVWCFGTVNKGHLGTGDHIRRKLVVQLTALSEQGVQKISCGDEHTAALTIDGRLYLWGDNAHEQISHWLEKEDFSSPKRYHKSGQNILEVNCGQHSTFIVTNSLERFELSRQKHFAQIPLTNNRMDPLHAQQNHSDGGNDGNDGAGVEPSTLQFLTHGQYLLIGESNFAQLRFEHYLKYEQEYLQDILQKVAPFFPKFLRSMHRNVLKHTALYKQFFHQYNRIISCTAVNIQSMAAFSRAKTNCAKLCFVRNANEYISVYRTYVQCYCEILCSDDYKRMCETILPTTDFEAKFSTPLHHIVNYIEFAKELLAANEATMSIVQSAHTHWEQFKQEMDAMLHTAERTVTFWKTNAKTFPTMMHVPQRRFILDSKTLPLKLIPSSRFTSQWFLLFDDCFCVCSGSATVRQYQLNTLWVCSVSDKEVAPSFASGAQASRRFAIEIITPEERFVVGAQTLEAKFQWLDAMERYVRRALGRGETKAGKVPAYRVATHTFSDKHKSYAKCRYTGCWLAGTMHGNGYLEFPDGRVYTGQFAMGVISGFGRWIIPGISCYEGMFSTGKYHGQGTLDIQSQNGAYDGAFRNGQQNGHGVLINDHITYIGQFLNGMLGIYSYI